MQQANVLSLKYRPQRFVDVVGQPVACTILSKASATNAVAPAYILSGTRGVGKTTLARIFAKSLLCLTAPTGEPCNECSHCLRINKGQFVDVIELDAASHRSIDDIRDLRENVGFSPMEGKYKIFILDEAHMLTKEAYNALLKTLEEPPPFVVFIFASTDIQKFPATIISRCQHIVLKSVSTPMLVEHLASVLDKEGIAYSREALEIIACRGFGSVRDSLSLLGQVLVATNEKLTEDVVRSVLGLATQDIYFSLITALTSGDTLVVVKSVQELLEKGIDIKYFLQELTSLCRTLFLVKEHQEKSCEVLKLSQEMYQASKACVEHLSLRHIHICWQMILHGQKQILESIEPSIALELLLLNIVSVRHILPAEEYIGQGGGNIPAHPHVVTEKKSLQNKQDSQGVRSLKEGGGLTTLNKNQEPIRTRIADTKEKMAGVQEENNTTDTDFEKLSFREKMKYKAETTSLAEALNPPEEEIQSRALPPSSETQNTPIDMQQSTKEYKNKDMYPILNIIETEFSTQHMYIPKPE